MNTSWQLRTRLSANNPAHGRASHKTTMIGAQMRHGAVWIFVCAGMLSLAGCDGAVDPASAPSSAPVANTTVSDKINALEARGDIPKLDHSAQVEGPDANGNGVRDDIEQYIAERPDTTEQKQALTQFARALAGTLTVDVTSDAQLRTTSANLTDGIHCIWQRYGASSASKMVDQMRDITVNTRNRFIVYEKYNAARNGSVIRWPASDTCK